MEDFALADDKEYTVADLHRAGIFGDINYSTLMYQLPRKYKELRVKTVGHGKGRTILLVKGRDVRKFLTQ